MTNEEIQEALNEHGYTIETVALNAMTQKMRRKVYKFLTTPKSIGPGRRRGLPYRIRRAIKSSPETLPQPIIRPLKVIWKLSDAMRADAPRPLISKKDESAYPSPYFKTSPRN